MHKFIFAASREQETFNKPQTVVGRSVIQIWDFLIGNADVLG
jgi:hypothetical protein